MDRYFEPRDRVPPRTRRQSGGLTKGAKLDRHDDETEALLDLERAKVSMSAVVSAWGVCLVMFAGLLCYSILVAPDSFDILAIDFGDVVPSDGGADQSSADTPASRP